ncbi:methyltransferase [Scatolibacter rhodanostii]|uniref:methyltransferase n=1 Tax=Scatolibacter rhodanostii TaxID=2014781 RepID=UPI000C0836F9|nr:methyltransferase [Scatolibacter rhodanostii]
MSEIKNSPSRYYQIIRNYQEAHLLFAAIRLDVFSFLDTPQTAAAIAESTNCNQTQIEFMLLALTSCGLIHKQGDFYFNTPESTSFLSRNSHVFLGDTLLFRENMTSLANLQEKVQTPPASNNSVYDFAKLARLTIPEMYAGRVQAFMQQVSLLYPDCSNALHMLDLGGGAGILDIEFVKQYPNSKATILETPTVAEVTKEIVQQYQVQKNIDVVSGDFNSDSLGGPYDFIIASGILNFVHGDLSAFFKKLSDSLKEGGHLLLIGHFKDDKNNVPANMLGWLSGCLDGIPLPPNEKEIEFALQKSSFTIAEQIKISLFDGRLYQKNTATRTAPSNEVIDAFITLTEKIANSKTNVLNFGSEDMTFYRGEIHMIKTIGDYPGIHSAELARKYGITRPVVHKTLQKLSERGLIVKQDDPDDKKRYLLYLTEKGKVAYQAHKQYHEQYDKSLFDFLADTSGDKLAAMKDFLDYANGLIENHS